MATRRNHSGKSWVLKSNDNDMQFVVKRIDNDMQKKKKNGRDRNRTNDLLLARETRYQLRHTPNCERLIK